MKLNTLDSHILDSTGPSLIHQDGRSVYFHRCYRCGRDFAQGLNGGGWQAVNIGLVRIELLADSVTDKWLSEKCPGQPLWDQDKQARSMRHA